MRTTHWMLIATLVAVAGCTEEPRSTGPPRCEPPDELVLERGLKRGFRALSEDNSGAARVAFQEVLTRAPGHPEARAGMRVAEQNPHHRTTSSDHGGIVADGHDLPTHRPVDHDTYRLEIRAAEARAARRMEVGSPPDGIDFDPRPGVDEGVLTAVDLVVLHASRTQTALDRFVHQTAGEQSAHFLIDWDGTTYQTLDLALVARHTGSEDLDARSIAIELVTPLSQDSPPLPSHAKGVERPMSQRLRVQGQLVRAWGYTPAQMASLTSLLDDLIRTLPRLEGVLPKNTASPTIAALPQAERSQARGIVGALHLDPTSIAPGPGFDWRLLREALD